MIIVGAGIAGLSAALELAPLPVTVITKGRVGGGSSRLAQGGFAAAMAPGDSPALHAADTVAVAAGLADESLAQLITAAAPATARALDALGTHFDRTPNGDFHLHREAGHSRARILHAAGDATGSALMRALVAALPPSVTVLEEHFVHDLVVENDTVVGVVVAAPDGTVRELRSGGVLLAAGGVGQLYESTTNPPEVTGDGLALAARAGADLADLEFVQFHPTALAVATDPRPLVTEAVRGRGAVLVDRAGRRFMVGVHPDAELAPRDVVARGVWRAVQEGGAWLDARTAVGAEFPTAFPGVWAFCAAQGIDPRRDRIPVATAAHYHMGGVLTDADGRTSLGGLWACGEVASTGLHGANRLASNSLLEGAVVGARAAADMRRWVERGRSPADVATPVRVDASEAWRADRHGEVVARVRAAMSRHVDVVRTGSGLASALAELADLEARHGPALTGEAANMLLAARLIASSALERRESRGAHHRDDFDREDALFRCRQVRRLGSDAAPLGDVRWLAIDAPQQPAFARPALAAR